MTISVVGGAGRVGSTTLFQLVRESWVEELAVVDIMGERAEGEMLDLLHGTSLARRVVFSGPGYDATAGSDIVVITAGIPRKPGETRLDLLRKNVDLMKGVLEELNKHSHDYYLVMVANPVDVLTFQAIRGAGLPSNKVIGTGTLLDSVRFRSLLARRLDVSPDQVYVYMLGEHGDSMAPWTSGGSIAGVPLASFPGVTDALIAEVVEETRYGGAEVIKRKGGTFYAVAPMIVELMRSIAFDQKRILPVSTMLEGQLGMSNVALSLPCVIGRGGRERVIEPPLASSEADALQNSYRVLREAVESVGL